MTPAAIAEAQARIDEQVAQLTPEQRAEFDEGCAQLWAAIDGLDRRLREVAH